MRSDIVSPEVRHDALKRVGKMRVYDAIFVVLESVHSLRLNRPVCQDILGVLYDAIVNGTPGDLMDIAEGLDPDQLPQYHIAADWYLYFKQCGCVRPVPDVLADAYQAGLAALLQGVGNAD